MLLSREEYNYILRNNTDNKEIKKEKIFNPREILIEEGNKIYTEILDRETYAKWLYNNSKNIYSIVEDEVKEKSKNLGGWRPSDFEIYNIKVQELLYKENKSNWFNKYGTNPKDENYTKAKDRLIIISAGLNK